MCVCNCATSLGETCSDEVKVISINYKNYLDIYLGDGLVGGGLMQNGLFVRMLKLAVPKCCPNATLKFNNIGEVEDEIEELVLANLKASRAGAPRNGVHKFYFPEFAPKRILTLYDYKIPFVVLHRSPGPALIMYRPGAKEAVFVGEIFLKSWAIMICLLSWAWIVGIIVWFADHHVNAKDFPSPFYVGMVDGIWWSVVTMTTVGYGDKNTKGPFTRVIAIMWIMISTVLVSLFTANASSILAISRAEQDHSNTLGKKIGCFNSKHFFEDQLNLGAQMIGFSDGISMGVSFMNGGIDRTLFPNYLDYIYYVHLPQYVAMQDIYQLSNTFKYPFQIGMAYAVDPENITQTEMDLLSCLRSFLPTFELKFRRQMAISGLKDESIIKKKEAPLNSDNLISLSYWCLLIVACLVVIGLAYDYWNYRHGHLFPEHHIANGNGDQCANEGTNGEIKEKHPYGANQESNHAYFSEPTQHMEQTTGDSFDHFMPVDDDIVLQNSNYLPPE